MFLTKERIEENKNTFLSILEPAVLSRNGSKWENLKLKLEESDFFTAPASAHYHNSFEGGLCDHSLNVYYNLCSLVEKKHLSDIIDKNSIAIVALLHDISKIGCYVKSAKNKKVYSDSGSKFDELGRFDWISELSYTKSSDAFIYSNHETTSDYMIKNFVPLTYVESSAILNHHMGLGFDSVPNEVAMKCACTYELVALLHIADMISVTIDEKYDE